MRASVPERRPPLATIRFVEESPLRIEFEFASGDRIPAIEMKDDTALRQAWDRAGRALDEMVDDLLAAVGDSQGDRLLHPAELRVPFRNLLRAGRQLGQRLTEGRASTFNDIQRAFRKSRAGWMPFDPRDIPRVDVYADTVSFPLELLPVFVGPNDSGLATAENTRDVLRVGEAFLGFSTAIRRLPYSGEPDVAILGNDPKLPIQLVRYLGPPKRRFARRGPDEPGFAAEARFIESLDLLAVDGPWPTEDVQDGEPLVSLLVAALFDPETRLVPATGGAPVPAAITHFACHCKTAGRDSEDFELILSTPAGVRRSITFGEIQAGYGERGEGDEQPGGVQRVRAPLVFNACGSSVIDPLSAQSLHQWFLNNGHPTYVGTLAAVPDQFAAHMAELLYRFLLGGFSIGDALLLARRKTLRSGWGPLGLLYVLHGNDRLNVAIPHPDVLPDLRDD